MHLFQRIEYGVERFLAQAWRGSRTRPLAESRTIFDLVVRRCYSPEFFRKRKVSSLDDRLVRINVGGISVNFRTAIRLAFRFLSSPLSGFLTFLRDLFSRSIHRFLRSLL